MKRLLTVLFIASLISIASGNDNKPLPVDLERAIRICIIQSDSFGRAYVLEVSEGNLLSIDRDVFFSELIKAKELLFREYNDKSLVKKACVTIGSIYSAYYTVFYNVCDL